MPRLPINYDNTMIYKLSCLDPDVTDEYVGHTTNFVNRKSCHKSSCNNINSKSYNLNVYQFIRANGGWSNWSMILVETFSCKNEYEACAKEQYYIKFLHSKLNSNMPNQTKKEYRELNRDTISDKKKEYYELNKDTICDKIKEYKELNKDTICDKRKEYRELNKDILCDKSKEYRELNKDTISDKRKEYYELNKDTINARKRDLRKLKKESIK